MRIILASVLYSLLLMCVPAVSNSAQPVPNDCWSGVMVPERAARGRLVATGPVAQWRVGTTLIVYPTKESPEQIDDLVKLGRAGTFDTLQPISIIPTWISGPEPGKMNINGTANLEVTIKYRTDSGETGSMLLTYWSPISSRYTSLSASQQEAIALIDQQMHDLMCKGIP